MSNIAFCENVYNLTTSQRVHLHIILSYDLYILGGCCGSDGKKYISGGWGWAWCCVSDVQQ